MSEICTNLHQLFNQLHRFRFPFDASRIPLNGIYLLFEQGELAHGTERIVRVGTHTGDSQLRSRLQQHYYKENKDRSIFRKNIGRALLSRDGDPFLAQWELDLTTREAKEQYRTQLDTAKQKEVEKRVTAYIRSAFSFAVFRVDSKTDRLSLEVKLISTISLCQECRPSPDWLGLMSPKHQIRESGLWNVNELYKQPLSLGDFVSLREKVSHNIKVRESLG